MKDKNHKLGTFPFGNQVIKVSQSDKTPKPVFVLGVYGSAVFAQFISKNQVSNILCLPVDNEPEIFWNGGLNEAKQIISKIKVPKHSGKLIAENEKLNGMLGKALDKYFLHPLKLDRSQVWLCNLFPHFVSNKNERRSVKSFNYIHATIKTPPAILPSKKNRWNYIGKVRFREVTEEIFQARPEYLVTLGEQPLKWLLKEFNPTVGNLLNVKNYGTITDINFDSIKLKLIPLFHPRQILKEKNRESRIGLLHYDWLKSKAKKIKISY